MALSVNNGANNNGNNGNNNNRGRNTNNGGEDRGRNRSRREEGDKNFKTLSQLLRPVAATKQMGPRADAAQKWIQAALNRDPNVLPGFEIKVGGVSREQGYETRYPGVVIAIRNLNSNRVLAHVLMLEDGEPLIPRKRTTFRGDDITPVPVASKTWDNTYLNAVQTETKAMFKDINDLRFATSGVTVIPHNFAIPTVTETTDTALNPLDSLFIHVVESSNSQYNWLTRNADNVKLGETFDYDYEQIVANIDQTPTVEFDHVGQPKRSDFCISLSIKTRDNDRDDRDREEWSYNKSVDEDSGVILRVTGYVEPFYTELDLDKKKPRNFGINIIANGIEGNSSPSPELFLYAMASLSILTNNDMWVNGFKPSIVQSEPTRNLGGLFLEIPDEDDNPMERRSYANTAIDDFLDDVDFLFSNQVIMSLDCSESGPTTWITDLLRENDVDAWEEAADNLTDNEYSRRGSVDDVIIESETRRFYQGEYQGEHTLRSAMDVGYLYLINAFDENASLKAAEDWDFSLEDNTEAGLFKRLQLIRDAVGHNNFKITGYCDRVRLDNDFFGLVVEALDAKRMLPSIDAYTQDFRPKQRLSAERVQGAMDSKSLGRGYRGPSSRSFSRNSTGYRDRD